MDAELSRKWTAVLGQIGSSGLHFAHVSCSPAILDTSFVIRMMAAQVRAVQPPLGQQRLVLYIVSDDFAKQVISESLDEMDANTVVIRTYTDDLVETGALARKALVAVIDSHWGRWPTNAVLAAAAVVKSWAQLDKAGTHFCGSLVTLCCAEDPLWRPQAIERIFKAKLLEAKIMVTPPEQSTIVSSTVTPPKRGTPSQSRTCCSAYGLGYTRATRKRSREPATRWF